MKNFINHTLLLLALVSNQGFAQVLWSETFTDPDPTLGSTVDNGATAWSTVQPPNGIFATGTIAGADVFVVNNTDGEGVWTSEWIDISLTGYALLDIDVGSGFTGTGDYCRAYYSVDNGPDSLFYSVEGSFIAIDAGGTGVVQGDSVRIRVRANNDGSFFGFDTYTLDNIEVTAVTTLYSRKDGDWDDVSVGNSTWSAVGLGGASCNCVPTNTTRVEIGNSNTVAINTAANTTEVSVLNTGTLQWTSTNSLSLRGNLNVAAGGTISKNGNAGVDLIFGFNIPYLINNSGISDLGDVLNNDDGPLVINNNGTFDAEVLDLNGTGTITVQGGTSATISNDILFEESVPFTNSLDTLFVGDEINFESVGGFFGTNTSVLTNNGSMSLGNRIIFNDDDPVVTNNGTMILVGDIESSANTNDDWSVTNSGSMFFEDIVANNSDFTFDNSGTIVQSGRYLSMGGTESVRNLVGGNWSYGGFNFSGGIELYCNVSGANTFSYTNTGAQTIITPQDAYYTLKISGTGNKTAATNLQLFGNLDLADNNNLVLGTLSLTFSGVDGVQNVLGRTGVAAFQFYDLILNNTSGATPALVFDSNVGGTGVTNSLTLTQGIIDVNNMPTGAFLFDAGTSYSGANATNFIDGPVQKEGNTAFEFPIGRGTQWAPLEISAPQNATTTFTAKYLDTAYGSFTTAGFSHVSYIEYWTLERGVNADSVRVRLYWKDDSRSDVQNLGDLRVARFSGGIWGDEGQNANSGTVSPEGWVESNFVNSFSPFTLASLSGLNALPVELLSFEAEAEENTVNVRWETIHESNNKGFQLERSFDGLEFELIASLDPLNSNSGINQYSWLDAPERFGNIYYRLRQIDLDGTENVYKPVSVYLEGNKDWITVFPNPIYNGKVFLNPRIDADVQIELSIYNESGSVVFNEKVDWTPNDGRIQKQLDLPPGAYIMDLRSSKGRHFQRMIFR